MNTGFDRHFPEQRTARDKLAGESNPLRPVALCAVFTAAVWEEYAMGMRSEKDCTSLEEHLLICPTCQNLLAAADEYIQVVKVASALAAPEDGGSDPPSYRFRDAAPPVETSGGRHHSGKRALVLLAALTVRTLCG